MDNTYGTVGCVLVLTARPASTQSLKANVIWMNDNLMNGRLRDPAH
jgi:hypothetical protein